MGETNIDILYRNMLECAVDQVEFVKLGKWWGNKGTEEYLNHKISFCKELREMAKRLNLRVKGKKFYVFNGKIYVPIDLSDVRLAYNMFLEKFDIKRMLDDKIAFNSYFVDVLQSYNKMTPTLDVIAFNNGVLNTVDMKFTDFSPKYHVTFHHSYNYNPNAKCKMWQAFLKEVLPDKSSRVILQMFLGLGLIERSTVMDEYDHSDRAKVELCLLLVGSGSNGKSVIYNTAMGVFGSDRISGADYNDLTGTGDEGMRARRLLRGAIFNWSSDSDIKQFGKRTGIFKKIVSGEPVPDRGIGEDVQMNIHMPYLIFNINGLPKSDDSSLGFIRRLQYISFETVIPKERQNKSLSYDLQREYSGIFNWIVRGTKELKRRKFVFPDSEGSRRMLLKTMIKTNPVFAWLSCYGIRASEKAKNELSIWVNAKELMESLSDFCDNNEGVMVSGQFFGASMNSQGFMKKRRGDGMYYQIYGCSQKDMKIPFSIEDDSLGVTFVEDRDTFIDDND